MNVTCRIAFESLAARQPNSSLGLTAFLFTILVIPAASIRVVQERVCNVTWIRPFRW